VAEESFQRRVVGRYVLYGELASGGMATVHFGRLVGPVGFARTVAIKRLHAHLAKDPEFVAMFLDEARLVARISHPNVVPTLDVVAEDGELLLVMEYVQGESLGRLVRAAQATGGVPSAVASAIFIGVLEGLHAAHEARSDRGEPLDIVHRDVSPQNILVGIDGVSHVLDFGIAKAAGRLQHTTEGQLKGKFAYMSPEQLVSGSVDRRTDIYAASVVLWEALVGTRLFKGETPGAVVWEAINRDIPAPSSVVPCLPEAIDAVVLKGLAREQNERYATAHEMALALEDAIPPATPRKIQEWIHTIAFDVLARRAKDVAEIEVDSAVSSVQSGRTAQEVMEEASNPSAASVRSVRTAASTGSSTTDTGVTSLGGLGALVASTGLGSSRRKKLLAATVGAILVVAIVGLVLGASSGGGGEPSVGVAASGRAATTSTAGAGATRAALAPSLAPSLEPSAPTSAPATSAEPTADADAAEPDVTGGGKRPKGTTTAARPTLAPPSGATAAPPPTKTQASDCSNPFTIDASGRKRPRPECFR
jgi:serine/threonine protein kinase